MPITETGSPPLPLALAAYRVRNPRRDVRYSFSRSVASEIRMFHDVQAAE